MTTRDFLDVLAAYRHAGHSTGTWRELYCHAITIESCADPLPEWACRYMSLPTAAPASAAAQKVIGGQQQFLSELVRL